MAVWQLNIYFIPRQALLDKYGDIPLQLYIDREGWGDHFKKSNLNEFDLEDALSVYWWLDLSISFDSIYRMLIEFGDEQEWTKPIKGLRGFGDTESNDISVCFDEVNGTVEELSCRLDLRKIDNAFLTKVLIFAKKFDCLFMNAKGFLFQPIIDELLGTIEQSNANSFVKDPFKFLDDISTGVIKPE